MGRSVRFFRNLELVGRVPPGLVEQHDRVRAGRDVTGDLVEMLLHRLGIGRRHRQGGAEVAGGTDRAEQIRALVALVGRLARAGSLARPLVDEAVLLADPHLILEPQLDPGAERQRLHNLRHLAGEIFLKVSIGVSEISCMGHDGGKRGDIAWHDGNHL